MSSIIISSYYNTIKKVLDDKTNQELFNKYVNKYIDRNSEILTYNIPLYRLFFYDTDRDFVFSIFKLDPEELEKSIKSIPNVKSSWKLINNPFNILMLLIIRYFELTKNKLGLSNSILYLTLALYSSLHAKYYPFPPNKACMEYTLNRISNKFLFKQYPNIMKALYATSEKNHQTYKNTYLTSNDDEKFLQYFVSLRNRLNNQMKNFTNEYMKDYKEGNYLNTSTDSTDEDNYRELSNVSSEIVRLANKYTTDFLSNDINESITKLSSDIANCSEMTLRNTLQSIKKKENQKILDLFISILQVYLSDNKNSLESIGSKKFFAYCLSAYTKSNTKDKSIILIKEILEYFLTNHCNKYNQTDRELTKLNYKKSLYIYFILLINYNKNKSLKLI